MALKIAELAPERSRSFLSGTACADVDNGDASSYSTALLRDALGRFADGPPLPRTPGEIAEAGSYQVALIPLPELMNYTGSEAPVLAQMNSVFVLPLTWKDLVTRLRAEPGPSKSNQASDVVGFGAIRVNLSSMEVNRSGKRVPLTAMEFKLLRYFIANPVKVISRDELLNEVWGFGNYPCTRTVDSHLWRLRRKLEVNPGRPAHFHTVHAMGYKFVP